MTLVSRPVLHEMATEAFDSLFASISDLVMRHSPSGVESEVDDLLKTLFKTLDVDLRSDASGNLVAMIAGSGGGSLAITAHKDEIGMMVTAVQDDGRIRVRKLGGSYPWVYGEGIVDLLGDAACISGVLSFGSRHVSHASPQHVHLETAPVRWADTWIETKLTATELAAAGVRPGTRAVIGKHRKAPRRLGDYIASYTLDNKASVAILLELAKRIHRPRPDVYLVATAKEEVGAMGAMYFTQRQDLDALIALEVAPLAAEYSIVDGAAPVLLAEDSYGLYDNTLNDVIRGAAARREISLQLAVISNFGSDGSVSMKAGHVPRAACLGFPTQNTHGYEIAHLGAIENCVAVLEAVCEETFRA
jgi:putative aminopeptidase FrvX